MAASDRPFVCGTPIIELHWRRRFAASLVQAEWPAPANVRAVVVTRDAPAFVEGSPFGFNVGTRCGDDAAAVAGNRAYLREALALPSEPCWLRQVHGVGVATLDFPGPNPPQQAGEGDSHAAVSPLPFAGEDDAHAAVSPFPLAPEGDAHAAVSPFPLSPEGDAHAAVSPLPLAGEGRPRAARTGEGKLAERQLEPEADADAAVTRMPGVVLAIQTADCLPVLFCAEDGSEIAAAHAGWRGLCAGVLENSVSAMRTPRANVLAWLGPAIAAASFEVGGEVRDAFLAHDPAAAAAFVPTRPGHWQCDLYALARQRLRAAGVERIHGGGFDTFTDPRLHSFRRDGARSGRMASLLWMETPP